MSYPYIPAKTICYGGTRSLSHIYYIVIHYTANKGDTAKNNCNFFKNGVTRNAGAHFFVSQNGDVCQSIGLERAAYSVGGFVTSKYGAASYYKKCTNTNSVSIELCDNVDKDPSVQQTSATKELVKYIQSKCPNAKTILRHWDVSGKPCPVRMTGSDNSKWINFKKAITGDATLANYSTAVTSTPGTLKVDGIAGPNTIKAWQYILKTPVDGVISSQFTSLKKYHIALTTVTYGSYGSPMVDKIQEIVGLEKDGQLGPVTIKKIQERIGAGVDGYFGPETARKLQERLNTGKF